MKISIASIVSVFGFSAAALAAGGYDVAAFVWPAYHPEPRWKELGIFSHGNGEWQNVYEAVPKKEGHVQPKVPLWGYEPEDNPIAVARKIDAALASGINVFIYDWYWYGNRPFLEGALNNGFLKAPNNERMKFFLMWANHDVTNLWDNKNPDKKTVVWNADVSYDEFTKVLVPRFIEYFKKPNYYKIDGKPVFSVYNTNNLVRGMGGSLETAKKALEYLDAEAAKAGLVGINLMLIHPVRNYTLAKFELPSKAGATAAEKIAYLGFKSFTTYNWVSESWNAMAKAKPEMTYDKWVDLNTEKYDSLQATYPEGQYFPHVSTGWDTNPRYPGEYQPSVAKSNPADFERGLRVAKAWLDKNTRKGMPKLLTLNAWNEWTEGCMLEPSEEFGYGFLNATAKVFGGSGQAGE